MAFARLSVADREGISRVVAADPDIDWSAIGASESEVYGSTARHRASTRLSVFAPSAGQPCDTEPTRMCEL